MPNKNTNSTIEELSINTIRTLSMDGVQKANSGHPGTPMALAPLAYELYQNTMSYDPENAHWANRDRFILSNGHASMLLYSMIHLSNIRQLDKNGRKTGKPALGLGDLKKFRQLNSLTPGHPEYKFTTGVEVTTGPLGQGIAMSVGVAMGQKHLAAKYNKPGHKLFDFNTYAINGDGCFMEGISNEAASLAGHLGLDNLCWFYDNNHITIEGNTNLAYDDDVAARFKGYGWHVCRVSDVNDLKQVRRAINAFKKMTGKPTLVITNTHIGYGAPHKQDTASAHGEPLGVDEIKAAKKFYGWPQDKDFYVPNEVKKHFAAGIGERGAQKQADWKNVYKSYSKKYPSLHKELELISKNKLPKDWEKALPVFKADEKGSGSRVSGGEVLNAVAAKIPWLIGGSADLAPSTKTLLNSKDAGSFQKNNYGGRNLHFGIREFGMGAALNGLSTLGLRAFGSTFFTFSDYARSAIRMSAIMEVPAMYIFTHDSIGVGEDGPTHQPIEHLVSLRAMPNTHVLRPADANEVSECYKIALKSKETPSLLILSRQNLPVFDRKRYAPASGVSKGAYVLADWSKDKTRADEPKVILISTGSEVHICVDAYEALKKRKVNARVVSMPCVKLFEEQSETYQNKILPKSVRARVSVEQAAVMGWEKFVGLDGVSIGMTTYGKSAPFEKLRKHFGFTVENIVKHAVSQVKENG